MAKLEYASGLSPDGGNTVWVRLPLLAPLVPPPDTCKHFAVWTKVKVGELKGDSLRSRLSLMMRTLLTV